MSNGESKLVEKVYSKAEAQEESLKYFNGDKLASDQWIRKYALKDNEGNLYENSPKQMHERIASEVARIETNYGGENQLSYDKIYSLLENFERLIPGGSNLAGIGNNKQTISLSNCFVIGNTADSYGGILKIDQEQVQLMKRRGGVGHDLSHIRAFGSEVKNSALTSTGIVPFMDRYSNSTKEVAQDGRRGALMLSFSIKHPDAENFIDAKIEEGKITGANISIKIDDEFMNAVKNNEMYKQQFPIDSDNPTFTQEIDAKKLWNKITHNAWKRGEPGILFWDRVIEESIPDVYHAQGFKTVSTNPCGEIPLCPYDSCRLLALNLFGYVEKPFTKDARFKEKEFKQDAKLALRIMDDIIDLEAEKIESILEKIVSDPEPHDIKSVEIKLWKKILKKTKQGRRMGIGITAEGDMLAAIGLRYGTDEATKFSTEIHKNLALTTYEASTELAEERGAFPIHNAKKEKNNPFIKRIKEAKPELYERMVKSGRRNIAMLTIAPTGTISIEAQTTSGIEPAFNVSYKRNVKVEAHEKEVEINFTDDEGTDWHTYNVFHPKFEIWLKVNGYNVEEIKEYEDADLQEVIKKSPYYKATSKDVNWVKKVEMQGAVQKWVDHSISATTNVPEDVSEELIAEIYMKAWESGCKGMTVYREGSRGEGIMNSGLEKKVALVQNKVKPHVLINKKSQAIKYKIKRDVNGDSLHIILTSDLYVDDKNKKAYFIPDEIFQVRAPLGAATSVTFGQSGIDRTDSLRNSSPDYAEFVSRLQSASSNELEGIGPTKIKSIEHASGLMIEDYFLTNGIVGRDKETGRLINLIDKEDLRKVELHTEEYNNLMSQIRIGNNEEEAEVSGNNGKLDKKFVCLNCHSEKYTFAEGCNSPKCAGCGHDNGAGCG